MVDSLSLSLSAAGLALRNVQGYIQALVKFYPRNKLTYQVYTGGAAEHSVLLPVLVRDQSGVEMRQATITSLKRRDTQPDSHQNAETANDSVVKARIFYLEPIMHVGRVRWLASVIAEDHRCTVYAKAQQSGYWVGKFLKVAARHEQGSLA
ncbi:MAG: hypothetical protein LQ350_003929 [Teloschistes chrysophthalmus]|nr:MAG: hypothetical protein LQ350_003929 [Niorma chrysophthalma]